MPRFLNAAVLRRLRPWRTAATVIPLSRQRNWWLAAVLRRFICGGCGGSRKPAENKDAAVLRRMGALTPHTPYAPSARFTGAQGAVPGGATSRLAPFLAGPFLRSAGSSFPQDDAMTRDTLSTLDLSERSGQRVIGIRRVPHYQVDGPVELRPGERPFAAGPHHDAYICMVESEGRLETVTTACSISIIALRGGARP